MNGSRREPAVVRTFDDPEPSVAIPASNGGDKIYCATGTFDHPVGDGLGFDVDMYLDYTTLEPTGLLVPLDSRSTIFVQCQFSLNYQCPVDTHVLCRAWCDLDGGPPAFTVSSPVSSDCRQAPASGTYEMTTEVSLGWTCVITRDTSTGIYPHVTMYSPGGYNFVGGSYFLSVIVGPNNESDCVSWATIG